MDEQDLLKRIEALESSVAVLKEKVYYFCPGHGKKTLCKYCNTTDDKCECYFCFGCGKKDKECHCS